MREAVCDMKTFHLGCKECIEKQVQVDTVATKYQATYSTREVCRKKDSRFECEIAKVFHWQVWRREGYVARSIMCNCCGT